MGTSEREKRWVNAVVTLTVPLDVPVDAPTDEKLKAVEEFWDELEFGPREKDVVSTARFEDVENGEPISSKERDDAHLRRPELP